MWWRAGAALVAGTMAVGVASTPANAHEGRSERARPAGMAVVRSNRSFDDTWNTLIDAINANPNLKIVAMIDHAAAAKSVGLSLDPNRVVVFGNAALGTPLMQQNQTAGIDLPQKIQVFVESGRVWVGFNDASYLAERHELEGLPVLDTIAAALRRFTSTAADSTATIDEADVGFVEERDGLTTVASDAEIDTTWTRLLTAINASPARVAFTVDHAAAAAAAGLDLRPTRLVVFGNPNLGTPLIADKATTGIDLPLKILVWQDATGVTQVTTNDIDFVRRRHRLHRQVNLAPLKSAVARFVQAATTTPSA